MRILAMFLFVMLSAAVSLAQAEMVSIAGDKVNMRSGPGGKAAVLWELGKGYPLKVLQAKGDWVKVRDFENDVGWVHRSLIGKKSHLIVQKKMINLRSGPGVGYKLVARAEHGTLLRILGGRQGWFSVTDDRTTRGWVKKNLVWGW